MRPYQPYQDWRRDMSELPENNGTQNNEEQPLNNLIASAIQKKKESPVREVKRPAVKEMTLEESIAQAKYNKENGIRPTAKEASDEDMSIEDMVAAAMKKKNHGESMDRDERYATRSDIKAVRPAPKKRYDDVPEDDDEDKTFWEKTKDFLVRHKLKFMIAGMVLVVVALIALLVFIILFNHYYNRIENENASIILESINSVGDSDTIGNVYEYEDFLQDQIKDYSDIMASQEVYNILLVGEDLRDTAESSRGNTDVMMLVSINRETKKITLTSFMRDIYLYIPGYYSTRLNAAYATGGAELLQETIEKNFGIKIDNYVIVNFYTFIDIIEILGGVDVEITQDMVYALRSPMMEQNMYLGNPSTQDIITEPGYYHLNGNQALGYARIRHGVGDDFGRTARQREIITKMIEKSKSMSFLEMKEMLDRVTEGDNVRWNLSQDDVLLLLGNAVDYYRNYEIQQIQIPAPGMYSDQIIRDMQVLCPDFAANIELLQMAIYGKTFIDPSMTVTFYLPPSNVEPTTPPTYSSETTTTSPTETTTESSVTDVSVDSGSVTDPSSGQSSDPSSSSETLPSETTTSAETTAPPPVTDPPVTQPSDQQPAEPAA